MDDAVGDDMKMGEGGMMMMVMTFTNWSDYQLKILFDGWDVTTRGQFALSWFAIMGAGVAYHYLRYKVEVLEAHQQSREREALRGAHTTNPLMDGLMDSSKGERGVYGSAAGAAGSTAEIATSTGPVSPGGSISLSLSSTTKYYLLHAATVSLCYGLSLMLMLVAMTYNPALFVALMVGWASGDFLFHRRTMMLRRVHGFQSGEEVMTSCH